MQMQSSTCTLGQRLHSLRKYRNLSLQELSEITGISRSNLNRYERNQSKPTTEFLKELCAVYRVSSDYLLFGVETRVLKEAGWSDMDPQLRQMMDRLVTLMSSDSPHMRSWAIVQFANAFQIKV